MSSVVKQLIDAKLMTPEHPCAVDTVLEVIMGSKAYGVSQDDSDVDIYAVCMPPKTMVFPH